MRICIFTSGAFFISGDKAERLEQQAGQGAGSGSGTSGESKQEARCRGGKLS